MIKVKRENVIYSISEEEKKDYVKRGFSLLDEKGNVIKEKETSKTDSKELKALTKQVEDLKSQVESLTTENTDLKSQVESLSKPVEKLSSEDNNNNKDDKKSKNE